MKSGIEDLWQQASELQNRTQKELDKIQEVYTLEKRPICSLSVAQNKNGNPIVVLRVLAGEIIALQLKEPIIGSLSTVANQIFPTLTFLLK